MATYAKICISGAANGLAVKVVATATAGTTIHTAPAGTASLDEVWLWAVNSSATIPQKLTLEWGQADAPDGNIEQTIPCESGLVLVAPGLLLQNSLIVKAFSTTANITTIHGFVNRITA